MARIHCFPPLGRADARVLILGSMPGKVSLQQQQYYALPHNAFWQIIAELLGPFASDNYQDKLGKLEEAGIALWDVLASCERESSLDSHIRNEAVNDFASFFKQHAQITHVFFNGAKAEQSFRKYVLGKQALPPLEFQRLPSTSPAHAGMRYAAKLTAWRSAIQPYLLSPTDRA